MRTLQRFATVCFLGASFAALISACGSSDASPPAGGAGAATAGAPSAGATNTGGASTAGAAAGGAPGAGGATLTGNATNGATLYTGATTACNTCHGANAEGMLGPNISNTAAGIAGWTEAQFANAIRNQTNRAGAPLCALMPKLTATDITDQGIADVYAFVMTKMSATAVVGSYCMAGCTPACSGKN